MARVAVGQYNLEDGSVRFRVTDQSGANAPLELLLGLAQPLALLFVTCRFSGAPGAGTFTVTLDSGQGVAWDTVLFSATLAQNLVYEPTAEILIHGTDDIDVDVPAAGAGVTSSVAIYARLVQ